MARPKQPISLLEAKGKKHLTKAEIEDRKSKEIKAPFDKIVAPDYLPKKLKKEFNEIAKQLIELEIMSNLDVDSLARFIIAKSLYIDLSTKLLNDPGLILDNKDILSQHDKLFKQCRASASDLGLTITSRCKLVVPKKEEVKKDLSIEDQLFGGL